MYLSPDETWDDCFADVVKGKASFVVHVNPRVMMETVREGAVVQIANGTLLVRDVIPPMALACAVSHHGVRGYFQCWNSEVAALHPSSSGASTRRQSAVWSQPHAGGS